MTKRAKLFISTLPESGYPVAAWQFIPEVGSTRSGVWKDIEYEGGASNYELKGLEHALIECAAMLSDEMNVDIIMLSESLPDLIQSIYGTESEQETINAILNTCVKSYRFYSKTTYEQTVTFNLNQTFNQLRQSALYALQN